MSRQQHNRQRTNNTDDLPQREHHDGDWRALMAPVAQRLSELGLIGPSNRRLSTNINLRFNAQGSLSVNLAKGTWFDHERQCGGGVLDLVADAMNGGTKAQALRWLQENGFIAPKKKDRSVRRNTKQVTTGTPVATFDYRDAEGVLKFQVLRFEPKKFSQRRPNGQGGWIPNMQGVCPLPYRLQELGEAVAAGQTVFVLEGEKNCDHAAKSLGIVATTNAGGAGKWRSELNSHFEGADVVLVPDNDVAGRNHMRKVAAQLVHVAERVRILDLGAWWSQCPNKGDVSNWIEAGGTSDNFWRVVEQHAAEPDVNLAARLHDGNGRGADHAGDGNWRTSLLLSPGGPPKPLVANALIALRSAPDWQGVVAFDEHSMSTVAHARPPWERPASTMIYPRPWTPCDDVHATEWLQREGIECPLKIAQQAIETVAQDRKLHPIRDYLAALRWDGRERVSSFASAYLGAEETPYTRAVSSAFLISAVARIREPGCKADHMLVLEGPQGRKKSSALAALFTQRWFTDELAEIGTKDSAMQLRSIWLVEIAELDAMSRADISRVKAFLSRTTDRFRPPYGSRVIECARQCVFAGSTNEQTYLKDPTGGRRFWPIRIGNLQLDAIERDRDQLFAEAVTLFESGGQWWLDPETERLAADEQAARYHDDPWDASIASFLRGREEVTISEILTHVLEIEKGRWTQADQNRIARSLRASGWERFQARDGPQGRMWKYRRHHSATGDTQ
jgi:Virulence-associated protein E-like domain